MKKESNRTVLRPDPESPTPNPYIARPDPESSDPESSCLQFFGAASLTQRARFSFPSLNQTL